MSDRQVVRAVILDAGGVMLFPDMDWTMARCREQGISLTITDLVPAYYRAIYELDVDLDLSERRAVFTSLENRRWYFTHLLAHAGVEPTLARQAGEVLARGAEQEFPRESDMYHYALPGLRQQLERIRAAGFLLGSASNNDGALADQLRSVGVFDLFCALFDSGLEGVAKPAPELLLRTARALGVPPSECLYVGDVDRVDGRAARAAKMCFALMDPLAQKRPGRPLSIAELDDVPRLFVLPERYG